MQSQTKELKVILTGIVKDGWYKCCFTDMLGDLHYFIEQKGLVATKNWTPDEFPVEGTISCLVLTTTRNTAVIDIHCPLLQRDQNGESVFEVYLSQLCYVEPFL